ncbi:hypothetical protein [Companilactobacillus alimentarius]|uniref:Uncharacterized protein n=1 Tax=Companilactobacillus alimentarius DSM 20249 TaxID=1423720 RepID=A0A2K9HKB9_9LACO|nr:hypothetical protein [Companilactobacillus alimentarius]AUI72197.1 hypothetical protein LA20249_08380 [Companilactobacillus alimentarius DSM 20249]KRK76331.1 hypothetical protein FC67_GL000711 [Companilactobacillus alimentarius DSM 20249]MDT6952740.1 hypothetical protein [Companilactobacillus alimentarius]MDT6952765.1 hypothetical protein [Companilactobacillus alimentarius]GEO45949.1 hypothetical protein LAL01_21810 [Companilactobacillus alimentarius]
MKKLNKKYIKWIIVLFLLAMIVVSYALNLGKIKDKTVDSIAQITIPFSLIVNPKNIDEDIAPKTISLDKSDMSKTKQQALNLVSTINDDYHNTNELSFLSNKQEKALLKRVHKKSHRYITNMTLLNFGKDTHGKYITVSCNRYDDTKNIVSYRYRLYYRDDSIVSAKYLNTKTNKYAPQYVMENIDLGNSGVNQAQNFVQRFKTAIINSNLTATNANEPGNFNQISINLGLDPDKSNTGLFNLAKNSNSRVSNFGIVGYQISDVPRYTRFYLKQLSKSNTYYYTLTYSRNSSRFINFQKDIISTDSQNK